MLRRTRSCGLCLRLGLAYIQSTGRHTGPPSCNIQISAIEAKASEPISRPFSRPSYGRHDAGIVINAAGCRLAGGLARRSGPAGERRAGGMARGSGPASQRRAGDIPLSVLVVGARCGYFKTIGRARTVMERTINCTELSQRICDERVSMR